MTAENPVTMEDMHAHVDGHLDPARRPHVEAYLRANPATAARIDGWSRVNAELKAALAFKAAEPVPYSLSVASLMARRSMRFRPRARIAASLLIALTLGGGAGWFAHGSGPAGTGLPALIVEASSAHRLFTAETKHPVEFGPDQRTELASWAGRALGYQLPPPDLSVSGYHLLGGRIVTTEHGPACLYMYQNAEANRITLFMRPMKQRDQQASMRSIGDSGPPGYAWALNGLGFTLLSSERIPALRDLSDAVKNQMSSKL